MSSAGGSLLLGEVPLDVADPKQLVAAIMALIPHWPTEDHRIMISELLTLTLGDHVTLLKRPRAARIRKGVRARH